MASRQRDDPLSIGTREDARSDVQRGSPSLDKLIKGYLKVVDTADLENDKLLPDARCAAASTSLRSCVSF